MEFIFYGFLFYVDVGGEELDNVVEFLGGLMIWDLCLIDGGVFYFVLLLIGMRELMFLIIEWLFNSLIMMDLFFLGFVWVFYGDLMIFSFGLD